MTNEQQSNGERNPDPLSEQPTAGQVGQVRDASTQKVEDVLANMLTPQELRSIYYSIRSGSEFEKNIRIQQIARAKKVSPDQILRELRLYVKTDIRNNAHGPLTHYHRTSFANFAVIAQSGKFLSRSKIKELHPEVKLLGWSSSDDVMFTRDMYDKSGKLTLPGLSRTESVGAAGDGVIFVMNENIMNADDYDAIRTYPTVSDLPIASHCDCLLVDNAKGTETVRSMIAGTPLEHVPVLLREEWERGENRNV